MLALLNSSACRWRIAIGAAALALLFLLPAIPAQADPIITATSVELQPGISSFFDVFVEIPIGDPVAEVGGFSVDVSVPSGSAVTFDSIDYGSPYVFGLDSLQQDIGGDVGAVTSGTTAFGDDLHKDMGGFVILNPGDTRGLFRIYFTLGAGAPIGTIIPITVDFAQIVDGDGNLLLAIDEPLQVATITAVPVPPTMVLGLVGGSFLFAARWRRRGSQVPA